MSDYIAVAVGADVLLELRHPEGSPPEDYILDGRVVEVGAILGHPCFRLNTGRIVSLSDIHSLVTIPTR